MTSPMDRYVAVTRPTDRHVTLAGPLVEAGSVSLRDLSIGTSP